MLNKNKMKGEFLIDINCDLGEGYDDAQIIPYISSANIATGFHAGSPSIMSSCIDLCLQHEVHIGAHPSFWDRENFGRTVQHISQRELFDILVYQIGAIYQMSKARNTFLHHVKPHGALYNLSAKNNEVAMTIAQAVKAIDSNIVLYGLAGSASLDIAKSIGLKTFAEGFADRRYHESGMLVSREQAEATHATTEESVNQAMRLAEQLPVESIEGALVQFKVDTICIHGDHDDAVDLAVNIYQNMGNLYS